MTPADRQRLANAMEAATGEPWILGMSSGYSEVPALDGATRLRGTVHTRITILRAGREGWLISGQFGVRRHRFPGTYTGRGWFDRFVVDALAMIASFDAGALDYVAPTATRPRRDRHAEHYRRLLAPGSGATENERRIAAARLGVEFVS